MLFTFTTTLTLAALSRAASLTPVTGFGPNPGNADMFVHIPDNVVDNPPVIVALHPCGGSAEQYYSQTNFPSIADQSGAFILIYPQVTHDFNCWDAATPETLTHDGGSDSLSVASMVRYALEEYSADPARVYMTGTSSGGIITNVLAATYPDIFAAGAPFSGMPHACLSGSPGSSPISADPACADGNIIHTPAEWADLVHSAFPGYEGPYPRMQIWHGTADSLIRYQSLVEQTKQWSTVHGVEWLRNETDTPVVGYTKMVYGLAEGEGEELMVAYSAQGVGHVVPTHEESVLEFFGLEV